MSKRPSVHRKISRKHAELQYAFEVGVAIASIDVRQAVKPSSRKIAHGNLGVRSSLVQAEETRYVRGPVFTIRVCASSLRLRILKTELGGDNKCGFEIWKFYDHRRCQAAGSTPW